MKGLLYKTITERHTAKNNLIDFLHTPAVLHQFVVSGIDIFRQRQGSRVIVTFGFSASAKIFSAS